MTGLYLLCIVIIKILLMLSLHPFRYVAQCWIIFRCLAGFLFDGCIGILYYVYCMLVQTNIHHDIDFDFEVPISFLPSIFP